MAEQGKICSIFIKKGKFLLKKEYSKDFEESRKSFSLQPVRTAIISVLTPATESQCSIPVQMAQQT
jgi:hypothetical protein